MTTSKAKKAAIAITATAIAVVVLGVLLPASTAATQTTTSTAPSWTPPTAMHHSGRMNTIRPGQGGPFRQGGPIMPHAFPQQQANITVGQAITVTSTQGKYFTVGAPGNNGTASGTLTFTVTGKLASGYTLSITGGTVTVAGTTYTVASGTAQMDRGASIIAGQGSTSPTGQFILQATARGSFAGSTGLVSLDLQSATSEYLVSLAGSITS